MLKLVYGKHFIVDVLSPSTEEVNSSFSFFFFFYLHLVYQVHDGPPTDVYRNPGGTIRAKDRRVYQTANIRRLVYQKVIYCQAVKSFALYNIFFITLSILCAYFA